MAREPEHGPDPPTWQREFHDPRQRSRRLLAEVMGTFLLVLAAVGGPVAAAVTGRPQGHAAEVTAPALTVMAVILALGKIGGAHLNPVVSIAFALRSEFPWSRVPGYALAQLLGGSLACLFLWVALGRQPTAGVTLPAGGINDLQAALVEAVLTAGLVTVILGTSSSAQNVGSLSAIAVGGYIAVAGLWAGSVTGASMNPVRSLAPALVGGDAGHLWVYGAGPLLGAVAAAGLAHLLRGPGGDPQARRAAEGS